jgi:hypothetical protein
MRSCYPLSIFFNQTAVAAALHGDLHAFLLSVVTGWKISRVGNPHLRHCPAITEIRSRDILEEKELYKYAIIST